MADHAAADGRRAADDRQERRPAADGPQTSADVLAQINNFGGQARHAAPAEHAAAAQTAVAGPAAWAAASQADFDSLIELITTTISPQSWDDVGGPGSISGFDTNLSLVVSQTQEVHEQIADLLEQLRRLQDLQVTIEVRFITLTDNFFERIGVDFDFDIDDNTQPQRLQSTCLPTRRPAHAISPTVRRQQPEHRHRLDGRRADGATWTCQFTQGSFGSATPQFGGFDANTAANFGFAILSDIEVFFLLQAAQGDTGRTSCRPRR